MTQITEHMGQEIGGQNTFTGSNGDTIGENVILNVIMMLTVNFL